MNMTTLGAAPQISRLAVSLARTPEDIEQAQRLRYRVFAEEERNMRLLRNDGLETDAYDAFCDHLIVKDLDTEAVVGTYRLLTGDRAAAGIGFYSQTEFDFGPFARHQLTTLELGRSCIAPAYRGGKTINLLWEGIAAYLSSCRCEYLIGCASIHPANQDELNAIYTLLRRKGVLTDRFGIRPLPSHRIDGLAELAGEWTEKELFRKLPPLLKGYQWLGAQIGGEPAYDALFDTVDFFIVLHKDQVTARYKKRFMQDDAGRREA
ncbi:GNAT family N-acetyltransferase [Paenibacillus athensensis]|uniref:GNAT family N-acetyltransferase n=1 Tax=Paenibacillus athensensis TaxID=1967502 RepID=A0A4Y8Q7M3_9BACL|nr:GNAT family N-acyltransferase [Paenibacillus athensensis]MCD1257448.1 GNAT family N-acetyltransferase [Paenibacillus athensensis]